jgi:hypothetical protein
MRCDTVGVSREIDLIGNAALEVRMKEDAHLMAQLVTMQSESTDRLDIGMVSR